MLKSLAALSLAAVLVAGAASAQDSDLPIQVKAAWARATAGAGAGAAYLKIVNRGDADDRLVGAETPAAAMAELHIHLMEGGVMKMRPVEAVEVKGGAGAELKPGGLHVMLMGLKAPLKEGTSFPMTLRFEKAGPIEVEVRVLSATAMDAASGMAHARTTGDTAPVDQDEGRAAKPHRVATAAADTSKEARSSDRDQAGAAAPSHAGADHAHDRLVLLPSGRPLPSLAIEVRADPVGGWNLHLTTEHFRFAPEHVNGENRDGEGHARLYVNGAKVARLYGPWFHIEQLPDGKVELKVALVANDHRPLAIGDEALERTVTLEVP